MLAKLRKAWDMFVVYTILALAAAGFLGFLALLFWLDRVRFTI